ncbi:fungal-specific transcription factor domain-containing protein [Xylaria intraflava]|nr:fungal-specific transcription factor domain-containing protein [Xylaria intraflava]
MSATAAAASHPKPSKILACVHCQYRKIKCDRRQPCSSCIKAKIACKPSTPAPSHKRRRPNQELLERLARCEQLLQQYADGNVPTQAENVSGAAEPRSAGGSGSQPGASFSAKTEVGPNPVHKPTGRVIQEDGNVRFMDNYIRISFHDELTALRNIIEDSEEQESEPSTEGLSPGNNAGMLLGVDDTADLHGLLPDFTHALRLWQLFLERVNPLTKVVHVPSLQPYVIAAATDINKVPLPYQALVFSIYTMAIVSLTSPECAQLLGMARDDALNRFTRGTKLALTRSNFLNNYDMTILQALTLYMLSFCDRADNHSTWIMGGTVMRIAQKMGYHRDGEQFNLSPFETEMRRRLWWQLLAQDSKYAMLAGLSPSWVPSNWDTKIPQNLDDSDLSPDAKELKSRSGPTEMAFVLLIYHYHAFALRSHSQFEAAFIALGNGGSAESIEAYRVLIDEIDLELARVEQKYVDPAAGGVQLAASTLRSLFIDKMRDMLVPMSEQPEWGTEIFDQIDSMFKSFVQSHFKKTAIFERIMGTGFRWYIQTGLQSDALLLFTARLYKRPTGKLTERSWTVLESLYSIHPELFDLSRKKMERQTQFALKAWAVREQALAQCGELVKVPEFISRLRQLVSLPRSTSTNTPSLESPASASQPSITQQASTWSYQQAPLDVGDMNQYLGSDMSMPNLSIDMWGNLTMHNNAANVQDQASGYDGLANLSELNFSDMAMDLL